MSNFKLLVSILDTYLLFLDMFSFPLLGNTLIWVSETQIILVRRETTSNHKQHAHHTIYIPRTLTRHHSTARMHSHHTPSACAHTHTHTPHGTHTKLCKRCRVRTKWHVCRTGIRTHNLNLICHSTRAIE